MRRLLRPLVGLLLTVVFAANALAPGLHGCEQRAGADARMAAGAHHGGMHQVAPAGHEHGIPEPSAPHRCDCVGHACAFAPAALPATVVLPSLAPVVVAVSAPRSAPALLVVRPARLLPPAQAPPAPLA